MVALLFVAASPLRRAEVAETLRVGPARGLRLEESGDQLGLVSAPDCAAVVDAILGSRCKKRCRRQRSERCRSSPTSSRSPAPTFVVCAAWTVTPLWKPSWRAGWSPKTHASAAVADRAF
jgi:hypothetical protein